MGRRLATLCALAAAPALGCFQTTYVNLQPRGPIPHHLPADSEPVHSEAWRHYYALGLAPDERVVDTRPLCGGLAHVDRIETGRSAVQGALATPAGIYAPYSASVVCDHGASFATRPAAPLLPDPLPTEFAVAQRFAAPADRVWAATRRALAERNLEVAASDAERGVLVVPRFAFDRADAVPAPLGHTRGAPHEVVRREGRLLLTVRRDGPGHSIVSLDIAMRVRVRTGNRDQHVPIAYEWREVRSNLRIEESLLERIDAHVESQRAGHDGR